MGLLDQQSQQNYYDDESLFGNYQFVSLSDIINQFILVYVGEDKIISKAKRLDVAFHAQRALAELSFDTFKSCKAKEFVVPNTLNIPLPQDYVNYTKISWVDSSGIKHPLYPTKHTSNPQQNLVQNTSGEFKFNIDLTFTENSTNIVLDKEYPQLRPGMRIISPHIPESVNVINRVGTDGSVTSIRLSDNVSAVGNAFTPTFSGTITSQVHDTRVGSLASDTQIYPPLFFETSGFAANLVTLDTVPTGVDQVSFDLTNDQIANLSVGMAVHAGNIDYIDTDAKVVAINGNKVTVSRPFQNVPNNKTDLFFVSVDETYTWEKYKAANNSQNQYDDYKDDTYWPLEGERYGLEPEFAQANGTFYIDHNYGKIYFSSTVAEKTVVLDYISDSLGTDEEMKVHKFAEEAMYRYIAHSILAGKANIPEYIVNRFKKEKFAAIRVAKLRLSNIKLEEITQILRGKSKQIKH